MSNKLEQVKERLYSSSRVVVLTGAGISAESGVPTFRGAEGLWKNYRAEELATPEAFKKDPQLVWEWYNWRREKIAPVRPNAAHYALAELEKRFRIFTLITQNVDGLHSIAGSHPIELHGSIWRVKCTECGLSEENRDVPIKILPRCRCGGMQRPAVVWFGEALDPEITEMAFSASTDADFMIVIGTSGVVQPAASLAGIAKNAGAYIMEVNPDPTPITRIAEASFRGKAGEIVPLFLLD